ncbi:methyltransferase domain-containing protein [Azospirillum sp. RWY-5-1]|uniref:Methyltransferase domain-containing protein n=1 Tax=Azospirillum oleiclasticum TaxID=2735135 RepID=A0ABX2TKR4_9PROT|nr:methyltransferase domain-containing protein [Azospirillum oleiclasticum]NYZ17588.1 methyltransferase domain-containing protein [Azospirillum oleiclasticum]NYZ24944.1 methyltransferase domain-containing protein [Azospirillum oleiclasticum]
MRRSHFEALKPVCPRCRQTRGVLSPLVLGLVEEEDAAGIRSGTLHCTDPACWLEFPIIDGAPVLVPDVRGWLAANAHLITEREDLTPLVESLLGDGTGPDSAFNIARQHRSSYAWDHYADLDPAEPAGPVRPGGVVRCLEAGLRRLDDTPSARLPGPAIDLGCACGRTAFELAARVDGPVLGIDLNWPLLRVARRALETGEAVYPRRRVGMVYDRRRYPVRFAGMERVDFWIADAQAPPFADDAFGFAAALNIVDCVASPPALLAALDRLVRPGGAAVLATPFDWSTGATPVEAWLGGHSQRGPQDGSSETMLRLLTTPGAHPQSTRRLAPLGGPVEVDWAVRLHERSAMLYRAHVVVLESARHPPDGHVMN